VKRKEKPLQSGVDIDLRKRAQSVNTSAHPRCGRVLERLHRNKRLCILVGQSSTHWLQYWADRSRDIELRHSQLHAVALRLRDQCVVHERVAFAREQLLETEFGTDPLDALEVLQRVSKISLQGNSINRTLTVLTCSSKVASSSTTIIGCGCIWRLESVHMWFTPPSMHFCKASALCAPVIIMTTSRA
jgi:hypothetical protein